MTQHLSLYRSRGAVRVVNQTCIVFKEPRYRVSNMCAFHTIRNSSLNPHHFCYIHRRGRQKKNRLRPRSTRTHRCYCCREKYSTTPYIHREYTRKLRLVALMSASARHISYIDEHQDTAVVKRLPPCAFTANELDTFTFLRNICGTSAPATPTNPVNTQPPGPNIEAQHYISSNGSTGVHGWGDAGYSLPFSSLQASI